MATQKQIDANRRNASKSTGPKTEDDKFKSRLNSPKHGLEALHVPLQDENPMEYHDLRNGLMETWQPANSQEQMLVDSIASAYRRMQRASRFEAALLRGQLVDMKQEQAWLLLEKY